MTDQPSAAGDDRDLPEVVYRVVDSPIGELFVAATPVGVVRVAYECEDRDAVLAELAAKISPRIVEDPRRLDAVARELDEYFAGRRREFIIPLDYSLTSGFRETVQRYLTQIGYGQTRTYKRIAEYLGNPGAVRAVGSACATNPLPPMVPCHRVLRTDGGLGGYRGGLEAKIMLLDMEGGA
ncbi:methylated-DNA--protein-cysteine methyltransferase [Gordonia hirsuta DSM 44140 = NBRC 16056]|uniref:methylated-DNA--[protein]-cysteine S-methyltransferase n=1 Tax=Gordonia hirsuta DSM 44140 = NBRC 16056 TaxID=1121927 RepID=L7L7S2_9ACTN|nr:methylated-DNA--[protein]-cysteine S-methyltransferase [Gordonia hirsuta]GAC56806.1 methylated-DNA--protein-cysteine methyltransferase [Gordonia hirsuta DSM 44140 = NBRC 16056]